LEQANALLAESYDAQTVDQIEQAYAEIVNDANGRLSDAYFELEALQMALQEVRDRNALLIHREDLYQQQLEQVGRLLG
jgi:hypothetical protein|tara:strand:- start:6504 stop:6740 length:237 start_codon:yes stop_codon:yes gene_type:complete